MEERSHQYSHFVAIREACHEFGQAVGRRTVVVVVVALERTNFKNSWRGNAYIRKRLKMT
jgi:hypothetical protein